MNVLIKNSETLDDKTYKNIYRIEEDKDDVKLYEENNILVTVIDTNKNTVII